MYRRYSLIWELDIIRELHDSREVVLSIIRQLVSDGMPLDGRHYIVPRGIRVLLECRHISDLPAAE